MTKQDLSLSVFTKENFKNLRHTSSNFRNSMYDELEVNKSRFKTVILTKAFSKILKPFLILNSLHVDLTIASLKASIL